MSRGENIYKRKDGRWEGRYIKGRKANGSIHYGYIYARTYRELRTALIEKKAQAISYSRLNKKQFNGTFAYWSELWMARQVALQVKESTYASYKQKLTTYVLPIIGKNMLNAITSSDIQNLVQKLNQKLAPSSLHIVFRIVKSCFETAKEQGYLLSNPCTGILLPKVKKKKPKALSIAQQKAVEQECIGNIKGLPILLALETGMRIGEICALKWEDIDFKENELTVRRTKQRIQSSFQAPNRTQLIETVPKTSNAERVIPLSKKINTALISAKKDSSSEYVVTNGCHPVEPRTLNYRFKQIKQQVGLTDLPFHSLRHTFATRCVESGANIAAISALLGHSSIKMTLDTYTSSFKSEQRAVIKMLENSSGK